MRMTSAELRERLSGAALRFRGIVRKVALGETSGGSWGVLGYAIPDLRGGRSFVTQGDSEDAVEVFGGINIYARPASGDKGEAVVVNVGGEAQHPVIAAVRNESARKRYVETFGELEAGAIAIFNAKGQSRLIITADGNIEVDLEDGAEMTIRRPGGVPDNLITRTELLNHTHASFGAPPTEIVPSVPTPFPGTQALKSE